MSNAVGISSDISYYMYEFVKPLTVFPAPFGPTINVKGFWNSMILGSRWE